METGYGQQGVAGGEVPAAAPGPVPGPPPAAPPSGPFGIPALDRALTSGTGGLY
jgi:hypothetical protein